MAHENTIIHAQLEVGECTAELLVNGIPAVRIAWSPTRIPIENMAVAQLLIPGTNQLELLVEPGSTPSVARTEKRQQKFKKMWAAARLIRFEEGTGGLPEDGEVLGEAKFAWEDDTLPEQTFPQSTAIQIEMGAAYGRWGFQDAPELVLNDALRDEANGVLDEVDAALRVFHEERFWELTELQVRDCIRAYPAVTESYLRNELTTMFAHYSKGKDPVAPRDREVQDFRLVGGGKLLQCLDKDWSTTFKVRDPGDGSAGPYSILLGRINGKLRIVR